MNIEQVHDLFEDCLKHERGIVEGSDKLVIVDVPGHPENVIVRMLSGCRESERYLDFLIERGDIEGEKFYLEYPEFDIVYAYWWLEKLQVVEDYTLTSIIGRGTRSDFYAIEDELIEYFPVVYWQIGEYLQRFGTKLSKLDLHIGNFGINKKSEVICFDAFYGRL